MLKAGFSTAAETDSSVWSSDAVLASLLGTREVELVFICRTVRGHGWFFLVKNRWALPVSVDSEVRYYGFC